MWFWIFVRRLLVALGPFEEPEDEPAFWAGVSREQWGRFVDNSKFDQIDSIREIQEQAADYERVRDR